MIPGYASAHFYTRSVTRDQLKELKEKVEKCFKAAALATGCTYKITWAPCGQIDGIYKSQKGAGCILLTRTISIDVFTNEVLAETYKDHMKAEGVQFHPRQMEESIVSGSTDMGNITYAVPGIHAG